MVRTEINSVTGRGNGGTHTSKNLASAVASRAQIMPVHLWQSNQHGCSKKERRRSPKVRVGLEGTH